MIINDEEMVDFMSIQVKSLTHVYSVGTPYETVALEDVSFEIEDVKFVGIIGHTVQENLL